MKEKTYSESIANAINNFLTEDDWHFSFDEQRGQFRFGLAIDGMIKNVSCIIAVGEVNFTVLVTSPLGADPNNEKMMHSMAEFVCRANYEIQNGNFEFNWRDGALRYKSFCDCEGIEVPSREMIRNSVCCPAWAFTRYGDGITDIIFLHTTALEAIENCEETYLEESCASIPGGIDESEDLETFIAQHLASLGFDIDDGASESEEDGTDDEESSSEDDEMDVVFELFQPKGDMDE